MIELSRQEGFGDEVKRRIILGTYVLLSSGYYDAYYGKAQNVRGVVTQRYASLFEAAMIIFVRRPHQQPRLRRGHMMAIH